MFELNWIGVPLIKKVRSDKMLEYCDNPLNYLRCHIHVLLSSFLPVLDEPPVSARSNQSQSNRARQQSNQNATEREPQPSTSRAGLQQLTAARERSSSPVRRSRHFKSGTRALMEIRKYQKSTALLLRKLPFARVVRENSLEHNFPLSDKKQRYLILYLDRQ